MCSPGVIQYRIVHLASYDILRARFLHKGVHLMIVATWRPTTFCVVRRARESMSTVQSHITLQTARPFDTELRSLIVCVTRRFASFEQWCHHSQASKPQQQ